MISQGDQWCKVKTPDGKTGYMMTDYLSILVQVPHGSTVVVLSAGKTWTKVRYNGYTGYMMTAYLKKR